MNAPLRVPTRTRTPLMIRSLTSRGSTSDPAICAEWLTFVLVKGAGAATDNAAPSPASGGNLGPCRGLPPVDPPSESRLPAQGAADDGELPDVGHLVQRD